jgi:hypothetical protein
MNFPFLAATMSFKLSRDLDVPCDRSVSYFHFLVVFVLVCCASAVQGKTASPMIAGMHIARLPRLREMKEAFVILISSTSDAAHCKESAIRTSLNQWALDNLVGPPVSAFAETSASRHRRIGSGRFSRSNCHRGTALLEIPSVLPRMRSPAALP